MLFLLSMQMIASNLSSDGRFVIARSFKPEDILRWDIMHADPYMDYKATDYSEDFQGEGIINEPVHEIFSNGMCDQQSIRSACACAQSDQSIC